MSRIILWFRRDLRLADNPAVQYAVSRAGLVLPLFILEPESTPSSAAARWWLHHGLIALDDGLRRLGARLAVQAGAPAQILAQLGARYGIDEVIWNRSYEPGAEREANDIEARLRDAGIAARSFNACLLVEPGQLTKGDGGPYRVFTPFWRALERRLSETAPAPAAAPAKLDAIEVSAAHAGSVDALRLLEGRPWEAEFHRHWRPGETGAQARLTAFLETSLLDYPNARDLPARDGTSRLSPHLHFGEVGPHQVWHAVRAWAAVNPGPGFQKASEAFLRQLAWREFAMHLLYHFPHTVERCLDPRFDHFAWATDTGALGAWQRGRTGVPIVDAGMRQLWQTGWMHNRVRMLAASLLTKNLRLHWREGARWFEHTLVDADPANNSLGWQWVAGCGADAAPYFRIFNPVTQGERFDPDGDYVRRWVPELGGLPAQWIHRPSAAPAAVREASGIVLGRDYPWPIVDLARSRQEALTAWAHVRNRASR